MSKKVYPIRQIVVIKNSPREELNGLEGVILSKGFENDLHLFYIVGFEDSLDDQGTCAQIISSEYLFDPNAPEPAKETKKLGPQIRDKVFVSIENIGMDGFGTIVDKDMIGGVPSIAVELDYMMDRTEGWKGTPYPTDLVIVHEDQIHSIH